jgi:hypothetical protein
VAAIAKQTNHLARLWSSLRAIRRGERGDREASTSSYTTCLYPSSLGGIPLDRDLYSRLLPLLLPAMMAIGEPSVDGQTVEMLIEVDVEAELLEVDDVGEVIGLSGTARLRD